MVHCQSYNVPDEKEELKCDCFRNMAHYTSHPVTKNHPKARHIKKTLTFLSLLWLLPLAWLKKTNTNVLFNMTWFGGIVRNSAWFTHNTQIFFKQIHSSFVGFYIRCGVKVVTNMALEYLLYSHGSNVLLLLLFFSFERCGHSELMKKRAVWRFFNNSPVMFRTYASLKHVDI